MSWNYRIILHDKGDQTEWWYGLHEVYYGENGSIHWTENPISFTSFIEERENGIILSLERALTNARSNPILIESDLEDRSESLTTDEIVLYDVLNDEQMKERYESILARINQ